MSYKRAIIQEDGLSRNSRFGDGIVTGASITTVTADAADTVTIAKMSSGILQYTGLTAGRNLTTDTAVNILASLTGMDVGDIYMFKVSITTAFAGTWVAGTGVTLAGKATCPASSEVNVCVIKTSATTVTWNTL